jgi:hypothetical protein
MPDFDQQIRSIAAQHNVSESSARQLVQGLLATGGGQVQFNIPEFGGMGQWMPGMIMVSDLFNHGLKNRVNHVCSDIAQQIQSGRIQYPPPDAEEPQPSRMSAAKWWPGDLGSPTTSGAQNNMQYAWFPASRRLAVDLGGKVWIYDTGDHQIGGVSQQQSGSGRTLVFTSQFGPVDLALLPVVQHQS